MASGNVSQIGENAFQYCTSLKVVTLSANCTTINAYAFAGCSSLLTVNLSPELLIIHNYAFTRCTSFVEINFGYSPKFSHIGEAAFLGCTALEDVRNVPVSIEYIADRAFQDCTNLDSFSYDGTAEQWSNVNVRNDWKLNTALTSIRCSDGSITLP